VRTTRSWNNLHQVRSKSKDWKVKYFFLEAIKPKGLNRIAKIGYGHLCLREENLPFNNNNIISYIITVNLSNTINQDFCKHSIWNIVQCLFSWKQFFIFLFLNVSYCLNSRLYIIYDYFCWLLMLVHANTLISLGGGVCIFGWPSRPDKRLVQVFFLLYVH
jgi:hypothetical protein